MYYIQLIKRLHVKFSSVFPYSPLHFCTKFFSCTLKVQSTAGFVQEQEIYHESLSRGRSKLRYHYLVFVHAKEPRSIQERAA